MADEVSWKDLIATPMALSGAVGYLAGAVTICFALPSGAQRICTGVSLLCIGISHTLAYKTKPPASDDAASKGPPS